LFYGSTKADVKAAIKQAQARVDVGAPAKDAKALLSAVVTAWIASTPEASDLKASTKVTYATLLRSQVLTDVIASKPLADLKPSHVEQLAVRMRVKGCSPSTVRQTYTVLRSVLETAVRDELLASNPAAKVKRPVVPRPEARYLSITEVASLLDAVKDSRCAPLLRLLVAMGLRRGEALALRWSDVDLTNGILRVGGTLLRVNGHLVISEPKTERSRRDVPLSPATAVLLRSVKASQAVERLKAASIWVETGLVFTTERGTGVDPRNARRAISTAAKA
jgi:integrase